MSYINFLIQFQFFLYREILNASCVFRRTPITLKTNYYKFCKFAINFFTKKKIIDFLSEPPRIQVAPSATSHQCDRIVSISPSLSGKLLCPIYYDSFIEEFDFPSSDPNPSPSSPSSLTTSISFSLHSSSHPLLRCLRMSAAPRIRVSGVI